MDEERKEIFHQNYVTTAETVSFVNPKK